MEDSERSSMDLVMLEIEDSLHADIDSILTSMLHSYIRYGFWCTRNSRHTKTLFRIRRHSGLIGLKWFELNLLIKSDLISMNFYGASLNWE